MTVRELFNLKVRKSSGCWGWKGNRNADGYARICFSGRQFLASRISWRLHFGEDPKGCVLHKCDNPECTNPRHLFLGSRADNVLDMMRKGRFRASKGEKNGRSKLSLTEVKTIRKIYRLGDAYQYELAQRFGVSQNVISKIVRGERWVSH